MGPGAPRPQELGFRLPAVGAQQGSGWPGHEQGSALARLPTPACCPNRRPPPSLGVPFRLPACPSLASGAPPPPRRRHPPAKACTRARWSRRSTRVQTHTRRTRHAPAPSLQLLLRAATRHKPSPGMQPPPPPPLPPPFTHTDPPPLTRSPQAQPSAPARRRARHRMALVYPPLIITLSSPSWSEMSHTQPLPNWPSPAACRGKSPRHNRKPTRPRRVGDGAGGRRGCIQTRVHHMHAPGRR